MVLEPGSKHYRWSVAPVDAWRLLTEPMSEQEAKVAGDAITSAVPHVHAIPANPRKSLFLSWDRPTAELFRDALTAIADSGRDVPDHIVADIEEWLAVADPYLPGTAPW
jgi:hypothetical protein